MYLDWLLENWQTLLSGVGVGFILTILSLAVAKKKGHVLGVYISFHGNNICVRIFGIHRGKKIWDFIEKMLIKFLNNVCAGLVSNNVKKED